MVREKLAKKKSFTFEEGMAVLPETSTVSFDASSEVHVKLGIDVSKGEQMVRSTVSLPHGTGKKVRIIAFVPESHVKEATSAGAIEAGSDLLLEKIQKGWLDFDMAVAHPDIMKHLGKVAKILGPKGLMPNPKAGTVSPNIAVTIKELILGRVEFRNDKLGNLHNVFGKISFGKEKLLENLKVYLKAVNDAKPKDVKGVFIQSVTLSTTMGPAVKVDPSEVAKL
ncbi:50S ribosomal protein L1 [Candidatus Peregrinibacteria bacterium]|nr:50S ribosomal protein L1 [Candidatus Peregrinibacteria bacterium]